VFVRYALLGGSRKLLTPRAWAVLGAWAAACTVPHFDHSAVSWRFFALGGRLLMRSGAGTGLHLYANHPVLQIGPVALGAAAVLDTLGAAGRPCAVALLALIGLALIAIVERTLIAETAAARPHLFVWALLFLPAWMELAFHYAHLDDGLALLFTALAIRATANRRAIPAGLLLALAVDSKPWALAFAPLLLAVGRGRRSHAFGAGVVGMAAAWAPFLVADSRTVTAATFKIPNTATSALRTLGVSSSATPVWDRPAQLAVGILLAALAVRTGRWPAALFAALCVRLLLDPGTYSYYTAGLVLAAAYVDLFLARRRVPLYTTLAVGGIYLLRVAPMSTATLGAIRADYCLLALAAVFSLTPRLEPRTAPS
jgi:hypothetical protein